MRQEQRLNRGPANESRGLDHLTNIGTITGAVVDGGTVAKVGAVIGIARVTVLVPGGVRTTLSLFVRFGGRGEAFDLQFRK